MAYYKIGNDVYEAGTNRHIELPEFQKLGLNITQIPVGTAPSQNVQPANSFSTQTPLPQPGTLTGTLNPSPTMSPSQDFQPTATRTSASNIPMPTIGSLTKAIYPNAQPAEVPRYATPPGGTTAPTSSPTGYFKVGNDVYQSGTNRHITLDEFQRLGLNIDHIPAGSLSGSMSGSSSTGSSGGVTGKPVSSNVSSQPTGNSISTSFKAPAQTTQVGTQQGNQQLNSSQFANVIDAMRSKLAYNNDLINARQLLITQQYDRPLTEAEIAKLPANFQDVARSGDNRQIGMRIRLLNDEIQGRTNTMDQSVQYLTTAYKDDLNRAEEEKAKAMASVLDFVGAYGDQAGEAIKAMYGEDYLRQLEEYGINVGGLSSLPKTLSQLQEERLANPGSLNGTRTYVDSNGDIIEIGSKQLSAAQANLLSEGNQLSFVLDPLYGILESKKDLFGPITGRIGQANPYNTGAQTIDDDLRRAAQTIGKYMEGGVLRKEDEEKYRKMLPQLTDTPDVARNKLDGVADLLMRKQQEYIDSYARAGYDVSNFISNQQSSSGGDADFWSSFKPEGSDSKTLGSLSAPYESSGNPGTVSTGNGDPGGVSYGTYQLTTNNVKNFVS